MKDKRIEWIDSLRAFAIFCIVLGHTLRGASIYYFLYSFHVPLFVVISGFCFNKDKPIKILLSGLCQHLYIPYLVFGSTSILIYTAIGPIVEGHLVVSHFPEYVFGMLYGNGYLGMQDGGYMRWNLPLWYIPCIIAVEILAGLLCFVLEKRMPLSAPKALAATTMLSLLLTFALHLTKINLPWGMETAIALMPFFNVGRYIKIWYNKTPKMKTGTALCIATALIAFGTFIEKQNGNVDYVCDAYGNSYLLFLLAGAALSLGFSIIAYCLPKAIHHCLAYIGQNTLPILLFHKFPIMLYVVIAGKLFSGLVEKYPLCSSAIVALVTIAMCLFVGKIVEKICPKLIGKKLLWST